MGVGRAGDCRVGGALGALGSGPISNREGRFCWVPWVRLVITYFLGGFRAVERGGGWTPFECGGEVVDAARCGFAVHSLNSGSFAFF